MQIERTKRTAQPPGGCYVPQNTRKESQKSEGEKCPRTFLFRLRRHNPHATHSPQRFRQYKLAVESHWMPVAKARLHFVAALYIIRHSFLNTRCKKKKKCIRSTGGTTANHSCKVQEGGCCAGLPQQKSGRSRRVSKTGLACREKRKGQRIATSPADKKPPIERPVIIAEDMTKPALS